MVKTKQVKKYSFEDWIFLKEIITTNLKEISHKNHSGVLQEPPGILIFVEYVINHKEIFNYNNDEDEVPCWINLRCKKTLFKASLENLPLLINTKNKTTKLITSWRLKISK